MTAEKGNCHAEGCLQVGFLVFGVLVWVGFFGGTDGDGARLGWAKSVVQSLA